MKLNMDDVRRVLLDIEENQQGQEPMFSADFEVLSSFNKIGSEQYLYTLQKIKEAGLVNASFQSADNQIYFYSVSSLTFDGHEFLDNIRSPKVWTETKSIAGKVGSVSLDVIGQIASNVVMKMLALD